MLGTRKISAIPFAIFSMPHHKLKFQTLELHCASLLCKIFASLARARAVYVQNLRDFLQTKLDSEINSPFLLNEHGDPRFFLQVFAKNSVMNNIFEAEKSLIVEHDFFWKIVPNWVYFGQREDFKLTTELSEKEK